MIKILNVMNEIIKGIVKLFDFKIDKYISLWNKFYIDIKNLFYNLKVNLKFTLKLIHYKHIRYIVTCLIGSFLIWLLYLFLYKIRFNTIQKRGIEGENILAMELVKLGLINGVNFKLQKNI